jgi:hypothetical protein
VMLLVTKVMTIMITLTIPPSFSMFPTPNPHPRYRCRQCDCRGGNINCVQINCEESVSCTHAVSLPGLCCPVCDQGCFDQVSAHCKYSQCPDSYLPLTVICVDCGHSVFEALQHIPYKNNLRPLNFGPQGDHSWQIWLYLYTYWHMSSRLGLQHLLAFSLSVWEKKN